MNAAAQVFDTEADRYDAWFDRPEGRILFENELQAVRLCWRAGDRPALEIGTGTGRWAEALDIEYWLDPAPSALRRARQRGILVTQGRGEHLPFTDACFGGILIVTTLCFADDPAAMLREAARVLHPEGHLLIGVIPENSAWGEQYLRKQSGGHPFFRTARFITIGRLKTMLQDAALRPVAYSSTLVQSRPGTPRPEQARTELVPGAGFFCVLASKGVAVGESPGEPGP